MPNGRKWPRVARPRPGRTPERRSSRRRRDHRKSGRPAPMRHRPSATRLPPVHSRIAPRLLRTNDTVTTLKPAVRQIKPGRAIGEINNCGRAFARRDRKAAWRTVGEASRRIPGERSGRDPAGNDVSRIAERSGQSLRAPMAVAYALRCGAPVRRDLARVRALRLDGRGGVRGRLTYRGRRRVPVTAGVHGAAAASEKAAAQSARCSTVLARSRRCCSVPGLKSFGPG